jgi:hypothetical protein
MPQGKENMHQQGSKGRDREGGIRQAQRRLQPAREGDEKLGVHILQRPVRLQEHEKGLEHPAAPRGVGTAAKAVGAPITRHTRSRVERELEVVGTEHAHSVSNASGHNLG